MKLLRNRNHRSSWRRPIWPILFLAVSLLLLSCSKSMAGKYYEDKGKGWIELKADGTFAASEGIAALSGATKGTYSTSSSTQGINFYWEKNVKQDRNVATGSSNGFSFNVAGAFVSFSRGAHNSSSETASGSNSSDSGKLTTAKAQEAVDKAITQIRSEYNHGANTILDGGSASVQGIQELPQENAAQSDVTYNGITSQCGDGSIREPWKNGVAVFKHYNDGRWVLTKLTTNAAIACWGSFTVNIEVK